MNLSGKQKTVLLTVKEDLKPSNDIMENEHESFKRCFRLPKNVGVLKWRSDERRDKMVWVSKAYKRETGTTLVFLAFRRKEYIVSDSSLKLQQLVI